MAEEAVEGGDVMYSVEQIEEPLYSILVNAGVTEVSHSDYEVLSVVDPATTQAYLEAMVSDPENYTWESIIYTLKGTDGEEPQDVVEDVNLEEDAAEAVDEEAEYAAAEEGEENIVEEVWAEEDEALDLDADLDPDGVGDAEDAEAAAAEAEAYAEGAGGLDPEAEGYELEADEGDEGDALAATVTNITADAHPDPTEEEVQQPVAKSATPAAAAEPEAWICSRCTFINKDLSAERCFVCGVSRHCEEDPGLAGEIVPLGDGRVQVNFKSHELGTRGKALRARFRVVKYNEDSLLGGKKDRIFEIDFFGKAFNNLTTSGAQSFSLPAQNLYRVERHMQHPTHLKLLFFKTTHPIDLIFQTSTERQRFIEAAALQRKNPVLWAPALCRNRNKEVIVKIDGTHIETTSKPIKASGSGMFIASRMPYEVLRVWVGTFDLGFRGMPLANDRMRAYCPGNNDIYAIGMQNVPATLRDGKTIQEYFTQFFGQNYYILVNSASENNIFAGIEGRRGDKWSAGVMLVVVRRNVLAKVANVDVTELHDPGQAAKKNKEAADAFGVFVSLRIQETTAAFFLAGLSKDLPDVNTRNAKLQTMLSKIKCGDGMTDISVRYDYFFVLGNLGYPMKPVDDLHAQIAGQLVLTDFQESPALADKGLSDRVLVWNRPRASRATSLQYGTTENLGLPNVFAVFDLYLLRPYLYCISPEVPPARVAISGIRFECDTLEDITDAEVRVAGEWFEGGVASTSLRHQGSRLIANRFPVLVPVCPAYEFLRAQSMSFSITGGVEGLTKGKGSLVASSIVPLRDVLTPDTPVTHSAFVQRYGTVIGILEVSVTLVLRQPVKTTKSK